MPLIVIAGLPCSGKSTVAAALAEACRALGQDVQVVDEDSLHLRRNDSYKDATSEKVTRGALLSSMERCLSRRRTVILDTHNNIKGYRYQLWCSARALGTRFCMVLVDSPPDSCRQWNQGRGAEAGYSEAIFEDLACRFERPNAQRNRWDSPLFTVNLLLGPEHMREQLAAVAAAVGDAPPPQAAAAARRAAAAAAAAAEAANHGGGAAAEPGPGESTATALLSGSPTAVAAAAAAAGLPPEEAPLDGPPQQVLQAKVLTPMLATDTSHYKLSATNLQHDIDKALQQVLVAVAAAQAAAGSGAPGLVSFGSGGKGDAGSSSSSSTVLPPLDMYRPMFLPELRRHKRSFMKLATLQTFNRLADARTAQRLFIGYLKDQLAVQ